MPHNSKIRCLNLNAVFCTCLNGFYLASSQILKTYVWLIEHCKLSVGVNMRVNGCPYPYQYQLKKKSNLLAKYCVFKKCSLCLSIV